MHYVFLVKSLHQIIISIVQLNKCLLRKPNKMMFVKP